ncbi:hypothetical protein [Fluviicola sp.]|jgi:hypothetical protein|uniref:hypothetical protein n=1 Tax=Fluviicola sp. TaxID=1917219 RepID=UPI0028170D60|nr:hypothetical protein [Fluviicola sp.]MDR0802439.1 hypothetical protein [Fluviicola sp.]
MSDYFSPVNEQQEKPSKRPVLLTVLCILSFIVVGFGLLGVLISLAGGQPSAAEIEKAYNLTMQMASDNRDQNITFLAEILEQMAEMTSYQQHHYWSVLLVNAITMGTGFAGVLMMFRGRKLGFHLYIIYNLLSVGGSFLIIPSHMIPMISVIMNLILSGVFVFLYSLNLKWMNK